MSDYRAFAPRRGEATPLRDILLHSKISSDDADHLESLFNQFGLPGEDDIQRRKRATGLVNLFASGERDQEKLVQCLLEERRHGSTAGSASSGSA